MSVLYDNKNGGKLQQLQYEEVAVAAFVVALQVRLIDCLFQRPRVFVCFRFILLIVLFSFILLVALSVSQSVGRFVGQSVGRFVGHLEVHYRSLVSVLPIKHFSNSNNHVDFRCEKWLRVAILLRTTC